MFKHALMLPSIRLLQEKTNMPDQQKEKYELWSAFKSGEEGSFSRLFFAFYPRLHGYGLKLVRDEELVKDVIQDFFLYLFEGRGSLADKVDSPAAYLLASFRRRLLRENDQRKKEQDRRVEDVFPKDELFVIGTEDILIREESEEHNKKVLVELLNELPPRQREILYLRYYQDLSLPEIADTLSITYQVVANHLYRALKKLQGSDQARRSVKGSFWFFFV